DHLERDRDVEHADETQPDARESAPASAEERRDDEPERERKRERHQASAATIGREPARCRSSAATTSGSNCVPAFARSSASAASGDWAARYGRAAVIASNASATRMIRAPSGICSPARLCG